MRGESVTGDEDSERQEKMITLLTGDAFSDGHSLLAYHQCFLISSNLLCSRSSNIASVRTSLGQIIGYVLHVTVTRIALFKPT